VNLYDQLPIGKRLDKKSSSPAGRVPIIDQSSDGIIGWHNEPPGILATDEAPVVTFANHTCEMRLMRRPFSVIQNVFPLVGRKDICDTLFLYYTTKGRVHLEEYKGHFPDFRRKWVILPPLPEQRAIAHILGALDDKIELNRRMNETLEAMARALFKSWFIDFDPVRAKAEGRDPGLPADIAALFPDFFVDSELGRIPKSWEVKTIGDLVDVVGGGTPSTKEPAYWNSGSHLWATPKDLSGLSVPVLVDTARRITDTGLSQISSGLLPIGTVLLSSRAPIGYLAIAESPTAINQGFIAMLPKKTVSNVFVLLWAKVAHDDIVSRANGSTFLEINKANFRPIPVVGPTPDIMAAFGRQARTLYDRIVANVRESSTLATLRDTLLPKLLSGELRVNDVESVIKGV
jgi:type I restriction enzyme S subunit